MSASNQSSSKKRGCLKWGGVALGALVLLLIVIVAIVGFQGSRAKAALRAQYPPPGQMVDVGGYKLHLYCQGSGSPTVVLVPGAGDFSLTWSQVQPEVAKTTRVCAYDFGGFGWSELGPQPPTMENILTELHTLLTNAGIEGPYVLVGHSLGGMYVRAYAVRYPEEVVGMVLVDSTHEDQMARYYAAVASHGDEGGGPSATDQTNLLVYQVMLRSFEGLNSLGILAMNPESFPATVPDLPEVAKEYKAVMLSNDSFFAAIRQQGAYMEENEAAVREMHITSLGDIPLVVLSSRKVAAQGGLSAEESAELLAELHTELAALSSRGELVFAEESSHLIQWDQPELVIEAINHVLGAQ
jgi:pimeloyl-ACP methyl ester carboxylesterase